MFIRRFMEGSVLFYGSQCEDKCMACKRVIDLNKLIINQMILEVTKNNSIILENLVRNKIKHSL